MSSVTETSFTLSYTLASIPGCPGGGGLGIRLYTQDDFGRHPVEYERSYGEGPNILVISGLTPGTEYYGLLNGGSSPFTGYLGPVLTLGTAPPARPRCATRYEELSRSGDIITARLLVTNNSYLSVPGWQVGWTWIHGERIVRATGVRVSGSRSGPVLTGTGRNRVLSVGEWFYVDLRVRTPSPYGIDYLQPTCTVVPSGLPAAG